MVSLYYPERLPKIEKLGSLKKLLSRLLFFFLMDS